MPHLPSHVTHPPLTRRMALQAGAIGLLGLGMNHVDGLRALAADGVRETSSRRKSVIYIFLSGGLAQHDSFDPKPQAPDTVRGEFSPIATRTPGIQICEHLPRLAACSDKWALVRILTTSIRSVITSCSRDARRRPWGSTPVVQQITTSPRSLPS